jgi:hypothetical protein
MGVHKFWTLECLQFLLAVIVLAGFAPQFEIACEIVVCSFCDDKLWMPNNCTHI